MYPIYKGTYERNDGFNPYTATISFLREIYIKGGNDFQRSIDYLESRKDIDVEKLAYHGISGGAAVGPAVLAIENRIKAGIFELGGFYCFKHPPEIDIINFTPRVKCPVLMLNGRYDYRFPLETYSKPMFDLLGTPEEHKRLIIYDTGHGTPRKEKIKEILDWLDRYLGPVK